MKIDAINSTAFQSAKEAPIKKVLKNTAKAVNLNPVKNYTQYLKEYGLYIKK